MFPYLEQPSIRIGPVAIQGFGVLVATGIVVGYFLAIRRMKATGLDAAVGSAMAMWMVVAGLAGSHLLALAQSRPAELYGGPSAIFKIWEGMSSFGGIVAGAAAGACFLARRRLSLRQMRAYFDAVAFAFPVAWMFGRAGCTIAHDHPGVRTNSILAVRYPDGSRFDAGLLEFLATALIASFFVVLRKRALPEGFYLAAFLLLYGPLRFLLETVRTGENTYLALTPGQYGAAAATLAGIAMEGPALRRKLARLPRAASSRARESREPSGKPKSRNPRRWVNISDEYRAHIVVGLLTGVGLITCGLLALVRRKTSPALLRLGSAACLGFGMSLIVGTVTDVFPCTSPS